MKNPILVIGMLALCLRFGCALAVGAEPDIYPESLKKSGLEIGWITRKVGLAEMVDEQRKRQIREIIAFSQMQLDAQNTWIIDGVRGKGAMPADYYKATVTQLLEVESKLGDIRKNFREGDEIYHFRSSVGDEGYILVRNREVAAKEWVGVR